MNGFKLDSSPGLTALTAHLTGRGALECPLFHPGCVELPGVVSSTPAQMSDAHGRDQVISGLHCTPCNAQEGCSHFCLFTKFCLVPFPSHCLIPPSECLGTQGQRYPFDGKGEVNSKSSESQSPKGQRHSSQFFHLRLVIVSQHRGPGPTDSHCAGPDFKSLLSHLQVQGEVKGGRGGCRKGAWR